MESAGWEWLVCDPRMQTFASCIMGFMVVYMVLWFMVYMRTRGVRGRFREAKIRETKESCKEEQSKISVLLPCKGVHEKTWSNWHSQIASTHGGEMEFIFAMESEEDPAYGLALKFKGEIGSRPKVTIKVINCGLSYYCTQKTHNLLEAVCEISEESKYVLFLDDDAEMNSGILKELVRVLEERPEVMIVSGWPMVHIPADRTTVSFASYMAQSYYMLSLLGLHRFSGRAEGIWGGCLLWRRQELLSERVGVIEAWEAHGYSDDMIMGGRASKLGGEMIIPAQAFLPSAVDPGYSLKGHWNYVFRQMFVCDTYYDMHDRIRNLWLLLGVSVVLLVPCIVFHALVLLSVVAIVHRAATDPLRYSPQLLASFEEQRCGAAPFGLSCDALLLAVFTHYLLFSETCLFASHGVAKLCEMMQPNEGDGRYHHTINRLKFRILHFFGFFVHSIFHSSAAIWALFNNHVVWSSIHYYKKWGKVCQVWRPDGAGGLRTVDCTEARSLAIAARRKRGKRDKEQ